MPFSENIKTINNKPVPLQEIVDNKTSRTSVACALYKVAVCEGPIIRSTCFNRHRNKSGEFDTSNSLAAVEDDPNGDPKRPSSGK